MTRTTCTRTNGLLKSFSVKASKFISTTQVLLSKNKYITEKRKEYLVIEIRQ